MSEKSLMKLASDLGVSFSAAKILEDHVRTEYDARLQAADKLCEAAKVLEDYQFMTGERGYELEGALRKAIAEYEGKA